MTANIDRPRVLGYIEGDLNAVASRAAEAIRRRTGRLCVVWVDAHGKVLLAPTSSPEAPSLDDIGPLVGTYLRRPGEIVWRDRIREALAEQADAMKVAA